MKLVTIDDQDHSILRRPAQVVNFPLSGEILQLLDEMEAFIHSLKSPNGLPAGLAATQVGQPHSIVFINVPEEAKTRRKDVYDVIPLMPLINPSYTPISSEGRSKDWEACYSVPDKMGEVWRYEAIQLEAMTRDGEKISREARGFLARVLQHEIGHLNGELFTDLIMEDCRLGSMEEMMALRLQELAAE